MRWWRRCRRRLGRGLRMAATRPPSARPSPHEGSDQPDLLAVGQDAGPVRFGRTSPKGDLRPRFRVRPAFIGRVVGGQDGRAPVERAHAACTETCRSPAASRFGRRQRSTGSQYLCCFHRGLPSITSWRRHLRGAASPGTFPQGLGFKRVTQGVAGYGRPMQPTSTIAMAGSVRERGRQLDIAARVDRERREARQERAAVDLGIRHRAQWTRRPLRARSSGRPRLRASTPAHAGWLPPRWPAVRLPPDTGSRRPRRASQAPGRRSERRCAPSHRGRDPQRDATGRTWRGRSREILSPAQRRDDLVQPREAE